jgi:ribosomal subunit interface protein
MRITITARHADISPDLRQRARDVLTRLAKVATRPHDGRAIFGDDHGVATVELRLHTVRGVVLIARAEGDDHRSALDRAAARVRRQLDKAPAKRVSRAAE